MAQKTTTVLKVKTPLPTRSTRRKVPVGIGLSEGEKNLKRNGNRQKTKDFLGNSRLDNIVGLFKREEVIYGDKKTAKQLVRDKKFKEGKKTKRNIKAKKSFGQRIGIINKGLKI
ncbi:MAG: hypothetical protein HOM71_04505 [Deltaproteobacteria bacterium]|nr:hypothetical protein [Deltaproteobacteria bacterium]